MQISLGLGLTAHSKRPSNVSLINALLLFIYSLLRSSLPPTMSFSLPLLSPSPAPVDQKMLLASSVRLCLQPQV
jgi:hypothetical protein